MSSIDERVVRMEFDNDKFEDGVKKTMTTLEKLNETLRFRYGASGFEDIQRASDSLDFSAISNNLWTVRQNFSFFGEFVRTLFDRISNSIINLGSSMVRGLTVEPLRAGWSEYELQMTSTQTIMASTGKSIEEITGYLDRLNTYADKTIYSFSDMTQNIGKFTNAGVDLDVAVDAIQGISNAAAVSGADAQKASSAMYNMSQALATGYMGLVDWRSIDKTAGMGTQEFRKQLIETALVMGTLRREGDLYVSTTTDLNGNVSRAFNSMEGFENSLSSRWATSEVLLETYSHYSQDIREMTEAEKESYEERLRGLGYTNEQIEAIEQLGIKAMDAATEIKTFKQLVDTVRESLGSGWTKSFQYIFGDLEEAKVLWGGVNDEINAILDPIAAAREEMLKFWHDNGGRDAAIKAISTAWQGLKTVMGAVSEVFSQVFPPLTGKRLIEITEGIGRLAERFKELVTSRTGLNNLQRIIRGVANALKYMVQTAKTFASNVYTRFKPLIDIFVEFGSALFDAAAEFGDLLTEFTTAHSKSVAIQRLLLNLNQGARIVVEGIERLISKLLALVNIKVDGTPLTDFYDKLVAFFSKGFDISNFNVLDKIASWFESISERIATAVGSLFSNGLPQFDITFESVLGAFENFWSGLSEWIPKIVEYLGSADFGQILTNVDIALGGGLLLALSNLAASVGDLGESGDLFETITSIAKKLFEPFETFATETVDKVTNFFDSIGSAIKDFQNGISVGKIIAIAVSIGVIANAIVTLSGVDAKSAGDAIASLVISLVLLSTALRTMSVGKNRISTGTLVSLAELAIVLNMMADVVRELSSLKWDELTHGLIGVGFLMAGLAVFANLADGIKVRPRSARALILLAVAIRVLEGAVVTFSGLRWEELVTGIIGVGLLIMELSTALLLMDGAKISVRAILAILMVADAVRILEESVLTFSEMGWTQLVSGLMGVGVLLMLLSGAMVLIDQTKVSVRAIAAVLSFAAAVRILEEAVMVFSALNWSELATGLTGVGILLLMLAGVTAALHTVRVSITAIATIAVLTYSLTILADVAASLSAIPFEELRTGIIGVAAILGVLVVAAMVLSEGSPLMLAGAASILILAAALSVLMPVMQALSSVAFADMAKAIGATLLALIALAGGLLALGVVSPAVLFFALSITALAAGIRTLAESLAMIPENVVAIAGALGVIAASSESVGKFILGAVEAIIVGLIGGLAKAIVAVLSEIPAILVALGSVLVAAGDFLIENIPYCLSVIGTLVNSFISFLTEFAPKFAEVIGLFVVSIVTAIVTWLPVIADALITGVITLINSVANGIRDNSEAILAAVRNILSSIIELVLTALADIVRLIPGVGDTLAGFLEDGRDAVRQALAPESFEGVASDAFATVTSEIENGGSELADAAADVGPQVEENLSAGFGDVGDLSGDIMGPTLEGLSGYGDEFASAADLSIESYMEPFTNGIPAGTAQSLPEGALGVFESYIPEFGNIGTQSADAYISDLGDGDASQAGVSVGSSGISGIESVLPRFMTAGENSTIGFSDGATSSYALERARSAGVTVANAHLGALQATLDEKSPSRATMKLGRYATEGFVIGIKSLTDMVHDESVGVGQTALDGIRNSLGTMSRYLAEDVEYDPTIRPVMDLSEIQNGIGLMNRIVDNGVPQPFIGVGLDAYPQSMLSAMGGSAAFGAFSSRGDTTEESTYNIYIDSNALMTDTRLNNAFEGFMREIVRKADM